MSIISKTSLFNYIIVFLPKRLNGGNCSTGAFVVLEGMTPKIGRFLCPTSQFVFLQSEFLFFSINYKPQPRFKKVKIHHFYAH